MQENCLFGSEGGAKLSFVPTPIQQPSGHIRLAKHTPVLKCAKRDASPTFALKLTLKGGRPRRCRHARK